MRLFRNKTLIAVFMLLCFVAGVGVGITHAEETIYYCPMHPQVVSDKPGECPICHMRLVLYKKDEAASNTMGKAVDSHVPVKIDQKQRKLVDIQTEVVQEMPLIKHIEAWGEVAHDFELYQLQIDFLRAERINYERVRDRTPLAQKRGLTEREKIAIKFQEMGLSLEWIAALDAAGVPDKRLIEHHEDTDIWVYLQLREKDATLVNAKDLVRIFIPSLPDVKVDSHVEFVDSIVNMENKTVRVRTLVENPGMVLKPNMSLNAVISVDLGKAIVVPDEALLFTGNRTLVFVEEKDVFTPREVVLGTKIDGYYEVKNGLMAGEKVSTSGNFFVDSESRLHSSMSLVTHQGHQS